MPLTAQSVQTVVERRLPAMARFGFELKGVTGENFAAVEAAMTALGGTVVKTVRGSYIVVIASSLSEDEVAKMISGALPTGVTATPIENVGALELGLSARVYGDAGTEAKAKTFKPK